MSSPGLMHELPYKESFFDIMFLTKYLPPPHRIICTTLIIGVQHVNSHVWSVFVLDERSGRWKQHWFHINGRSTRLRINASLRRMFSITPHRFTHKDGTCTNINVTLLIYPRSGENRAVFGVGLLVCFLIDGIGMGGNTPPPQKCLHNKTVLSRAFICRHWLFDL